MQKKNMEEKMVELSQEEMMDVSGGAADRGSVLGKLWNGIMGIFNNDNASDNK